MVAAVLTQIYGSHPPGFYQAGIKEAHGRKISRTQPQSGLSHHQELVVVLAARQLPTPPPCITPCHRALAAVAAPPPPHDEPTAPAAPPAGLHTAVAVEKHQPLDSARGKAQVATGGKLQVFNGLHRPDAGISVLVLGKHGTALR